MCFTSSGPKRFYYWEVINVPKKIGDGPMKRAPSQTKKKKVVMNGARELINMITLCNNTQSRL
jgi:hypothetical protein